MQVKNKRTGAIVEAVKNEDGTYSVEGTKLTREEMGANYAVHQPTESKGEVSMTEVTISNSDMGGNIGALAGALAKCQGEFTAIKKGTTGHGYNYADITAVLASTSPITSKYGISIIQMNLSKIVGSSLHIGVKTVIAHSDGGYISSDIYVPAEKTKMNSLVQMCGVNLTYLRRYGIQSALGLATTDNDGRDD